LFLFVQFQAICVCLFLIFVKLLKTKIMITNSIVIDILNQILFLIIWKDLQKKS